MVFRTNVNINLSLIGILISKQPECNQEDLENQGSEKRQGGYGRPAAFHSLLRCGTSRLYRPAAKFANHPSFRLDWT